MQLEAIYDHGKLHFISPVHLRHERIKVVVDVPDEEVKETTPYDLPPEVTKMAEEMERKTDEILNAPFSPDEELPELTEKQLDRIVAFELREDR